MVRLFDESGLHFEFGDQWEIEKLDATAYYRKQFQSQTESKSVDFIGCLSGRRRLFMVEVKNYRGYGTKKLTTGELHKECVAKVRDSIAAIIGALRMAGGVINWKAFAQALTHRPEHIQCIFLIEQTPCTPRMPPERYKNKRDAYQKDLQRQLRWCSTKVYLIDVSDYAYLLPDTTIRRLPQP